MANQNPEQIVRDKIDEMLKSSGWVLQSNKKSILMKVKGKP